MDYLTKKEKKQYEEMCSKFKHLHDDPSISLDEKFAIMNRFFQSDYIQKLKLPTIMREQDIQAIEAEARERIKEAEETYLENMEERKAIEEQPANYAPPEVPK